MTADPSVPVMSSPHFKAWPKHDEGGSAKYLPLSQALERTYPGDAHFTAYSVPSVARRLSKAAITENADGVTLALAVFDVDAEASHRASGGTGEAPAPAEWWASQRALIFDLLADHPAGFVYRTRGGYRLVYVLEKPVTLKSLDDAEKWTRRYVAWCNYLARRFGIYADKACKDWQRLYRLPHATRDEGGQPENRETIGDAKAIGFWSCELAETDWPQKPQARKYAAAAGGVYVGRGVLFNAFSAHSWISGEAGAGMWLARCPWEDGHSKGETYDSSTVLFEPSTGDSLGWLHCKHQSCDGRGIRDVLALFTREELDAAAGRKPKAPLPAAPRDDRPSIADTHQEPAVKSTEATFRSFADNLHGERQERVAQGSRLLRFGIRFLDVALGGIHENDLILLGAKTGVGKTELSTLIAQSNAARGKRVHYFALEAEHREIERRIKYKILVDMIVRARGDHARMNYLDWRYAKLEDLTGPYEELAEKGLCEQFKSIRTLYKKGSFTGEHLERHIISIQDDTDLIIVDHLQFVDSDDDNENRGVRKIVTRLRDAAIAIGKPIILVAHLRKGERRSKTIVPDVEDFIGTSDIPKIATKAIMLAPAYDQPTDRSWLWNTYVSPSKCRADGQRSRYVGVVMFNARIGAYERPFALGRLTGNGEKWEQLADADLPPWATDRTPKVESPPHYTERNDQ